MVIGLQMGCPTWLIGKEPTKSTASPLRDTCLAAAQVDKKRLARSLCAYVTYSFMLMVLVLRQVMARGVQGTGVVAHSLGLGDSNIWPALSVMMISNGA